MERGGCVCSRRRQIESGWRLMKSAIRMPATKFGAFLVSYCIRARIPLRRLADKVIRINASSITLCCKTIFAEAPAPDDATGRIRFCRIG